MSIRITLLTFTLAVLISGSLPAHADGDLEAIKAYLASASAEEKREFRELLAAQRAERRKKVEAQVASLTDDELAVVQALVQADGAAISTQAQAGAQLTSAQAATVEQVAETKASEVSQQKASEVAAQTAKAEIEKVSKEQTDILKNLGFGVAVSLTHDLGENDRVKSAQLVNNVVRVEDENNDIARIMLETHYFFDTEKWFGKAFGDNAGIGPFVAVQPGSEDIIDAVGFGLLVGWKRETAFHEQSSFNLGIGAVVDPNSKVLGDGIVENMPLPTGETQIRFKEKSQWGLLLTSSYSWN